MSVASVPYLLLTFLFVKFQRKNYSKWRLWPTKNSPQVHQKSTDCVIFSYFSSFLLRKSHFDLIWQHKQRRSQSKDNTQKSALRKYVFWYFGLHLKQFKDYSKGGWFYVSASSFWGRSMMSESLEVSTCKKPVSLASSSIERSSLYPMSMYLTGYVNWLPLSHVVKLCNNHVIKRILTRTIKERDSFS